jgi:hypothetical protein
MESYQKDIVANLKEFSTAKGGAILFETILPLIYSFIKNVNLSSYHVGDLNLGTCDT